MQDRLDGHDEGKNILIVAAKETTGQVFDITRTKGFDQSEQNAAQHRTSEIANAAENGSGERLQAEHEAHLVMGDFVIVADHDAGNGRQGRTNHKGRSDDAVDIHAHQ